MKRHDEFCWGGTARQAAQRSTRPAMRYRRWHVPVVGRRSFIVLTAMFFAFASAGCSQMTPSTESYEIVHTAKKGHVEANLKVNHRHITTAERIEARLEVLAPVDCSVNLPSADVLLPETRSSERVRSNEHKSPQLGDSAVGETSRNPQQFTLVDFVVLDNVTLRNGQVRHAETFVFEPFLPGDYIIPPLTVSWSRRPSGTTSVSKLTTKVILIQVVSLLPPGDQLPEIQDIAPLAELPRTSWIWIISGLILGLLVLPASIWITVRRHRSLAERPQPAGPMAHEIALQELEQLLAEHLIERGAVDPFYTRLSGILRHYLAQRFGFRAPVQTSEEFLSTITRQPRFAACYRETLGRFFTHCDLVKFARVRPESDTIKTAVHSCRQFIEQTGSQNETASPIIDVPGGGMP